MEGFSAYVWKKRKAPDCKAFRIANTLPVYQQT
jgi:hypothetical protein